MAQRSQGPLNLERVDVTRQLPAGAVDIVTLRANRVRSRFCSRARWPETYQGHSRHPHPSAGLSDRKDVAPKARAPSRRQGPEPNNEQLTCRFASYRGELLLAHLELAYSRKSRPSPYSSVQRRIESDAFASGRRCALRATFRY